MTAADEQRLSADALLSVELVDPGSWEERAQPDCTARHDNTWTGKLRASMRRSTGSLAALGLTLVILLSKAELALALRRAARRLVQGILLRTRSQQEGNEASLHNPAALHDPFGVAFV